MTKLGKQEILKMRIKRIEKEIRDTPYHKGTEHHIGRLRAKLSKLKDEVDGASSKSGGGGGGYAVRKQGDATVVLVGPPSVGKSTLLNKLTNAQSKIAPYAFTTVTVIPGMMNYKNARIQILDVPGLIQGAEEGKGRGKEVLSVVRGADLIVIMTEPEKISGFKSISDALERNGIRLNKRRPNVTIEKKTRGNVVVHSNIRQDLARETIKDVAGEFGYKNAEITIREKLTMDTLIDAFSKNRVYIPALFVINKADTIDYEVKKLKEKKIFHKNYNDCLLISAEDEKNLDKLRQSFLEKLKLVRIFLVRKDESPGKDNPLIVTKGKTLAEVGEIIGTDFSQDIQNAKIWGPGAKFPGQKVSLTTKVQEGMIVRLE